LKEFNTNNKLYLNILIAVLVNLLIKPAGLIIENIIQDQLGHEVYGKWAALNALAFLCSFVLDLGIQQYYIRQFQSQQRISALQDIPHLNSLKVSIAIVFPILVVLVAFVLGYSGTDFWIAGGIAVFYSINSLVMHIRMFFQTYHQLNQDTIIGSLDKALFILLGITFIIAGRSITGFIGIKALSVLITFVFAWIWWHRQKLHSLYQWGWSTIKWKSIIQLTYPLALITVLNSIHDKIDQVMINKLMDDEASGLYAAAYRWLDAILMFLWVIMPLFYTRFCKKLEAKEDTEGLLMTGQLFTVTVMAWATSFILFFGEHFFILFKNSTPEEVSQMTWVFKILSGVMLTQGLLAIYGTYILALNGEKFLNKISISLIAMNVLLNLYAIPEYGIMGAAWATFISGLSAVFYYIYYLVKSNQKVFKIKHIAQMILHMLASVIIVYLISLLTWEIEIKAILVVISFVMVFLVSGLGKRLKALT
jgi:O-antigen/teichoic acid export membrane protein